MSEAYFPDDLRLRTYAGLSETLRLEQALRTTLLTLAPVLPADGVFVNFFMKDELVVQFLAHATKARAEAMTARVPVSHDWLLKMSYERRGQCLVVNERREDPLTDEVLRNVLPEVRSYVMLRLLMDGIHYGVVCFYSTRPKAFGERHADIVRQLHNPIAINVGYSLAVYFRTAGLEMSAENRRLRENAVKASEEPLRELLARSPSLESIAQRIRRVAPYDATVIVTGESGCGKEVVATTIQQMSARRNAPFVRVNCAVLPGSLIESELFGFEEGDVIGVRHDQLAVCLTGGHDELTDHSLGLLRRGDADAALAHDTGRQRGGALQRGADAVRADGGDRTDRHLGQGLGKSRIGQFHHGQRTACLAKAAGSGSQLGGRTGQGLPGAQGLGGLCKQLRCHRLPIHPDAGRERLTACVVAACNETGSPEHRCREGGGGRFASRTGYAQIIHPPCLGREGFLQLPGRGKALGQRCKIGICLFNGHCVKPRFDVDRE